MRGIFSVRRHLIMRIRDSDLGNSEKAPKLVLAKTKSISEIKIDSLYSKELQCKLMKANQGLCEIYLLKNTENNILMGTISVMYKGGNELEYKIRDIEAFIYNVMIEPDYQGKGYAGSMIKLVVRELQAKSIHEVFLAVSTDNLNAIKAYKKVGFETVDRKTFVRVLRRNIPYYSL